MILCIAFDVFSSAFPVRELLVIRDIAVQIPRRGDLDNTRILYPM